MTTNQKEINAFIDESAEKLLSLKGFKYIAKIPSVDGTYKIEIGYKTGDRKSNFLNKVKQTIGAENSDYIQLYRLPLKKNSLNKKYRNRCGRRPIKLNNKKMLIGGGAIRRLTRSINRGTLGVILETKESKSIDKKYYGLTCSHVVKENSKIQYRNTSNHKYEIIGKVKHKNKISNLDYALIEIDKDYGFIPQEGIISRNSISNPDPLNIPKEGDNVHKYGSSTFSTNGYIESVYLKYVVNNKISIKHFLINTKNGCYFSSLGDSGSLVIDDKNNPIGIARALDGTKTIVIPINNILKSLKEHNFNHNFKFDFI